MSKLKDIKYGDLFLEVAVWGDDLVVDKGVMYINTLQFKEIMDKLEQLLDRD